MKVIEAVKLLGKKGFIKQNQVGSHVKFRKGSKVITLCCHGKKSEELGRKTVKQLLEITKN